MEKEDKQKNPGLRTQFWQLGRSAPFPAPHLFCFPQPDRRGFQRAAGREQSPPAQRQLPTGSVTAVTPFPSNQRQQWMTWGWCSPAPGLIGLSSGLNAKVSWQRERSRGGRLSRTRWAPGARRVLGSDGTAGEERHLGPLALLQVPSAPCPARSCQQFPGVGVRWPRRGLPWLRRHLRSRTDTAAELVSAGSRDGEISGVGRVLKVSVQWGLGEGCLGRSRAGRGESRGPPAVVGSALLPQEDGVRDFG